MRTKLHLAEDALALHLPLQRFEGSIDIVVTDENLHMALLFDQAIRRPDTQGQDRWHVPRDPAALTAHSMNPVDRAKSLPKGTTTAANCKKTGTSVRGRSPLGTQACVNTRDNGAPTDKEQ